MDKATSVLRKKITFQHYNQSKGQENPEFCASGMPVSRSDFSEPSPARPEKVRFVRKLFEPKFIYIAG